jgi:DNA repair protein RAD50
METKLNLVPDKLERLTSAITESKTEYEKLLQLKPIYAVVKDLREKDIPTLESTLRSLNTEIQKLTADVAEKEELVEVDKNDESVAKSLLSDATQIDRLQVELQEVNRKIEAQNAKLAPGGSNRTLQEVQSEKSELQLDVDLANQKLDRKRQKLNEHVERLQQLKSSLNELRSERLQIETDLQRRTRLEETKDELTNANEVLDREVQEASEQIRPLQDKIDDIVEEKDRLTRGKEQMFEESKEQCNKVREHGQQIERFQVDINRYVREGRAERLAEGRVKMDELNTARGELDSRRSRLQDDSSRIQEDLATQKIHRRDLTDNIQLRNLQTEVDMVDRKVKVEEERLDGLDVDNLLRERNSLEKEHQKLVEERDLAKSRQQVLAGEIKAFRCDLAHDMYKDAEIKYRDKMIALKTTEMANSDLDKYYKALDGTIMSYHNQKMSEINKIIRELWRNTYRGNDIETIEIRSDEEEGSGAAKTRRSYRYRVVMIKGSTELDMRGRCSAGQKVLASLIIRLALAETFCLNCGVFTLDEPTTNLDRENIESLASALVEIIKNRQKQRNFQLVVITHDEDFVELLGRSEYVDEYFRVSKNEFGCSRVIKTSVQDLHSK